MVLGICANVWLQNFVLIELFLFSVASFSLKSIVINAVLRCVGIAKYIKDLAHCHH